MKYQRLARLFIPDLLKDKYFTLTNKQNLHYLLKVMRKRVNEHVLIFNDKIGEYLAKIVEANNKFIKFELVELIRDIKPEQEINLIFAPIKHTRMQFLLEKATELGVTNLFPIQTKHSVVDKINQTKWYSYVKEASEQCGRLTIPSIHPLVSIDYFLNNWSDAKEIILCNEKENQLALANYLIKEPTNLMIGPEGGFSDHELEELKAKSFITSVHLGERTLRSETAAIVGLSIILSRHM